MKLKQKELGKLATRFFAYVQLRKMETIAIGELTEVLGLTAVQEQKLLYRLSRSGWIVRLRRGLYLVPPRIPAGPWSPGIYLSIQKLFKVLLPLGKFRIQVQQTTSTNIPHINSHTTVSINKD